MAEIMPDAALAKLPESASPDFIKPYVFSADCLALSTATPSCAVAVTASVMISFSSWLVDYKNITTHFSVETLQAVFVILDPTKNLYNPSLVKWVTL
jgi:hypothetical protein